MLGPNGLHVIVMKITQWVVDPSGDIGTTAHEVTQLEVCYMESEFAEEAMECEELS